MKRIFITLVAVLACVFNANAQFVVDSLGKVSVGEETDPQSQVYVLDKANENGLTVHNMARIRSGSVKCRSIYGWTSPGSKNSVGIHGRATGGLSDSTSYAIGIYGQGGWSPNSIGVMGMRDRGGSSVSKNHAGIYGSTAADVVQSMLFKYPGVYAGYFHGNVLATGRIYGNVYSLASVPKPSADAKVQSLELNSGSEESISDKLFSVQTVQFMQEEMVDQPASDAVSAMAKKDLTDIKQMDFDEETEEDIKTEMVKHYGLDGAQLKAVFPELVDEDSQGNYRINYSEMVPLLLQSIRELSARVEELEGEKSSLAKKAKATSIESESESTDIVRMSQNKPNPFSESSVITLSIPEGTKNAAIYIYDLSGKQVKNIPVDKRGETDITVYASDLTEGMFVYSLVTDGTVAATRRMMVVKN